MEDRIMFKLYRYGNESVLVCGTNIKDRSALLVGSAKWDNYGMIVMKINRNGEKEWVRIYRGINDWEAHFIRDVKEGYVISGAIEGIATSTGGRDWKGYLIKIDESGNKLWDFRYSLFGNECIYSNLPLIDGYLLFGITKKKESYPFLVRVDKRGGEIWHKIYDPGDTVAGILSVNEEYLLVWSDWKKKKSFIAVVNEWGETLTKKISENVVFLNMFDFGGEVFVTGKKQNKAYLARLSKDGEFIWEKTYGEGTGIALAKTEYGYLFGGNFRMKPFLYKIGPNGEIENMITDLWEEGWIEVILKMGDRYLISGPVLCNGTMHIGIEIRDYKDE